MDIYTHITNPMRSEAAAKIDQRIAKAAPKEKEAASERAPGTDPQPFVPFIPYNGQIRKAGTGCITQISEHCWEGRYSPVWPDVRNTPVMCTPKHERSARHFCLD